MSAPIAGFLQEIYPLPNEALDSVMEQFEHWEYPRNYVILRQGRICEYIWLMVRGAVRYYHTDAQGKETNVWFSIDEDIITETPSFVLRTPSTSSIQLLEDSELYAIHYDKINWLLEAYHPFALWYIKLFEKFYVHQIEDRIGDLQFLSAAERYHKLLQQFPDISQRVSLGQIASYLNITPETLSRIRAQK